MVGTRVIIVLIVVDSESEGFNVQLMISISDFNSPTQPITVFSHFHQVRLFRLYDLELSVFVVRSCAVEHFLVANHSMVTQQFKSQFALTTSLTLISPTNADSYFTTAKGAKHSIFIVCQWIELVGFRG